MCVCVRLRTCVPRICRRAHVCLRARSACAHASAWAVHTHEWGCVVRALVGVYNGAAMRQTSRTATEVTNTAVCPSSKHRCSGLKCSLQPSVTCRQITACTEQSCLSLLSAMRVCTNAETATSLCSRLCTRMVQLHIYSVRTSVHTCMHMSVHTHAHVYRHVRPNVCKHT